MYIRVHRICEIFKVLLTTIYIVVVAADADAVVAVFPFDTPFFRFK